MGDKERRAEYDYGAGRAWVRWAEEQGEGEEKEEEEEEQEWEDGAEAQMPGGARGPPVQVEEREDGGGREERV